MIIIDIIGSVDEASQSSKIGEEEEERVEETVPQCPCGCNEVNRIGYCFGLKSVFYQ